MNIFHINNYIFSIINNYLNYIKPEVQNKDIKAKTINHNNNQNNAPPKANHNKNNINKQMNNSKDNDKNIRVVKKKSKTYKKNINFYINKDKASKNIPKEKISEKDNINSKNDIIKERNSLKQNSVNNISSSKGVFLKEIGDYQNHFNNFNNNEFDLINNIELEMVINFEEYLETELEQMDYFDAIKRDERKFCKIFNENLMNNQMIINIFCINEPLKPRPIKIFLLILQIDLYLFVNGLFFNEEYISKIYHTKKETFSTVLERFSENLLYATLVGVIISYIIELFFIEEQKLKNILKREKENTLLMKSEAITLMKEIKIRYILFIIISFIIMIITFIHICCLNIVYYHTSLEWLIFSFAIILLIQLFSFLICFIESIFRFISFKVKSEKIYKLSLVLSEFL